VLATIADSQRFYPLTEKVRQVDFHGKYTAGSGQRHLHARSFPKSIGTASNSSPNRPGHLLGIFISNRKARIFVARNAATSPQAMTNGVRRSTARPDPMARCGWWTGTIT
jgi:hypothetical protein